MKKKLSFLLALMLLMTSLFMASPKTIHAAELTDAQKIEQELSNVVVPEKAIIDFPVVENSVYGSIIKWESSNTDLLNVPEKGGWVSVTRPSDDDVTVILTLTISRGNESKSRTFNVLVPKGTTQTNTYNISYVLNGGNNNENNKTSYKVGEHVELLAPTRGTVTFLGWYDNKDFKGQPLASLPKGTSGDVVLYAKWDKVKVIDLEITLDDVKTVYNALERFEAANLKVVKVYNDGTKQEATASEISFDKDVLHGNDTVVTLTCEGISKEINVTVNKINYDLSGIVFENKSLVYNGANQTLTYEGKLPEGLTAVVEGSAKNVTDTPVTVTLKFTNNNKVDYNDPTDLTAELIITKAPLTVIVNNASMNVGGTLPKFTVRYVGFLGSDNEDSLNVKPSFTCDATSASPEGTYQIIASGAGSDNYDITYEEGTLSIIAGNYLIEVAESDLNKVYNKANQVFVAKLTENGNEITGISFTYVLKSTGEAFDGATNAGDYVVVVSYNDPTYGSGSQEFTLHIEQATIDMSGISFTDKEFTYDGLVHSLKIEGKLPEEITKENYTGNDQINKGIYSVNVSFEYDTANYKVVKDLTANLTINEKELEESMFESLPSVSYTGSKHEPEIKGTYSKMTLIKGTDFTVTYQNNIEKGTAKAIVSGINNYTGTVTLEFEIGDSDLVKVKNIREELETAYGTVLSGELNDLPETLPVKNSNGSVNFWMSSSTALSVDAQGNVNAIFTTEAQVVTLYAIITSGDAAEYVTFTFTLAGKVKLVDEATKVEVDNADSGTTLDVKQLTEEEKGTITVNENDQLLTAYDINLMDSASQIVQPSGIVTVKLPVPAGADTSKLTVYHVKEDGTLENMNATVVDGYLVFTTTHFSTYIITTEKVEEEKGTVDNPYTAEEALAIIEAGEATTDQVYVKGIITKVDQISTSYGNATFYLGSLQVFRVYYLNNQKFTNENELIVGDEVVICGILEKYGNTLEITKGYVYEVTKAPRETFTVTVTGDGNGTPEVDQSEVLKGTKVKITFNAKDGYEVATIKVNDNEAFIVVGTTYELTITANTTIYVTYKEKEEQTGTEVTLDFTSKGYTNEQEVTTLTIDGVTITFDKGTNSLAPKYYTSGTAIRVYGGNTFIISSSKKITKVVFTFSSGEKNNAITSNIGTFTTDTWQGNSERVEFTVGGTSGHRRLKTIVVTLADSQGGDEPTPVTSYTVTFDVNGGNETIASQTVESGKLATKPVDPTKEGHTFAGWLLNGEEYDFNTVVTENITLTASWTENSQGGDEPTPSGNFELLDDISKLVIKSKIIIVNADAKVALGTNQKTNNREAVAIELVNGAIVPDATVQIIEIVAGTKEGTFAFKVNDGYLYAAGNGNKANYLRTEKELSDNSSWKIEITDGVASIVAQGENQNNILRYNTSKLFACYPARNSQKDVAIYIQSSAE